MTSWMILADVHIDSKQEKATQDTLDWVIAECSRIKPSHIFLNGDSTHLRKGDMDALHTLKSFVDQLSYHCRVQCVVGNHDCVSLYDRKVSSIGMVAQERLGIHVYSEITEKLIDGIPVVLIPWHENDCELVPVIRELAQRDNAKDMIIMGHIALKGARMTGFSHGTYVRPMVDETSHLSAADFSPFRHTFLGHYHRPATYEGKVTYVGSTRQINFGDADIVDRGYIHFHTNKENAWKLVTNPYAAQFINTTVDDVLNAGAETFNGWEGKSVRLIVPHGAPRHDEEAARQRLTKLAIKQLKVKPVPPSIVDASILVPDQPSIMPVQDPRTFLLRMVDKFVSTDAVKPSLREAASAYLKGVCSSIADPTDAPETLFRAGIARVTVQNFLGISGKKVFNYASLPKGIYMVQGKNGAGKSLMFDAIAFCLFKKNFRGAQLEHVLNNKEKTKAKCCVEVIFDNGMKVERSLKPSLKVTLPDGSLIERGTVEETQKALERDVFNVGWETFRRTVLLDSSDFLGLFTNNDKERNRVLENLLGMGVLDTISQKVEEDLKSVTDEHTMVLDALANLSDEICHKEANVEASKTELARVTDEATAKSTRLFEFEQEALERKDEICSYQEEVETHESEAQLLEDKISAVQPDYERLLKRHSELSGELRVKENQRNALLQDKTSWNNEMDALAKEIPEGCTHVQQQEEALQKSSERFDYFSETVRGVREMCEKRDEKTLQLRGALDDATQRMAKLTEAAALKREEQARKKSALISDAGKHWERAKVELARGSKVFEQLEARKTKRDILLERSTRTGPLCSLIREKLPQVILKAVEYSEASGNPTVIDGMRKDVICELQQIEKEALKDLPRKSDKIQIEVDELSKQISMLSVGTLITRETIDALKAKESAAAKHYQNTATTELDALSVDAEYTILNEEVKIIRRDLDASVERHKDEMRDYQKARQRDKEEYQGVKKVDLEKELERRRVVVEKLKNDLAEFKETFALKNLKIEGCRQALEKIEASLEDLGDIDVAKERVDRAKNEMDELYTTYTSLKGDRERCYEALRNTRKQMEELTSRNENRERETGGLVENIKYLFGREAELKSIILQDETRLNALRQSQSKHMASSDVLDQIVSIRKLFKEALSNANDTSHTKGRLFERGSFRKMCRAEHLSMLQESIDSNLTLLQGDHRSSHLSCKLSETFQMEATSDDSALFLQRSSGERRVTILSIIFAVIDTMSRFGAFQPELLTLDEVEDHLDSQGRASLHKLLTAFKRRNPRHLIFLVSHNEVNDQLFDGTISVSVNLKGDQRSYIAQTHKGAVVTDF